MGENNQRWSHWRPSLAAAAANATLNFETSSKTLHQEGNKLRKNLRRKCSGARIQSHTHTWGKTSPGRSVNILEIQTPIGPALVPEVISSQASFEWSHSPIYKMAVHTPFQVLVCLISTMSARAQSEDDDNRALRKKRLSVRLSLGRRKKKKWVFFMTLTQAAQLTVVM